MQREEAARVIRHSTHAGESRETARHPVIPKETVILCSRRRCDTAPSSESAPSCKQSGTALAGKGTAIPWDAPVCRGERCVGTHCERERWHRGDGDGPRERAGVCRQDRLRDSRSGNLNRA